MVVGDELKESETEGTGEMVRMVVGGELKDSGTDGTGEMVSEWWWVVS